MPQGALVREGLSIFWGRLERIGISTEELYGHAWKTADQGAQRVDGY